MEEFAKNSTSTSATAEPKYPAPESLVERLCEGNHAVEVGLRPDKSVKLFKESIDCTEHTSVPNLRFRNNRRQIPHDCRARTRVESKDRTLVVPQGRSFRIRAALPADTLNLLLNIDRPDVSEAANMKKLSRGIFSHDKCWRRSG